MNKTKPLVKILSLIVISLLSVFVFQKELYPITYTPDIIDVRYSFFVIPLLFALWLIVFCRVRVALWKWGLFALSYAVWFCLSYFFWSCLNEFLLGACYMTYYFYEVWYFIVKVFSFTSAWIPIVIATLAFCAIGVYSLFIIENIVVKKLFRLSFKKRDKILLFFYPVALALFAIPVHAAIVLAKYGSDYLKWLLSLDTYFYQGTIIFGYMMCEGLIFIFDGENK